MLVSIDQVAYRIKRICRSLNAEEFVYRLISLSDRDL